MAFIKGATMRHPKITFTTIGGTPQTIEADCWGRGITAAPEQDSTDYTTFCGTWTEYGPAKWKITFRTYQSFGTTGLWTKLAGLSGKDVTFELVPDADGTPGTVDNPKMAGTVRVPTIPFLDGDVNQPSELELVFPVQGEPTWTPALTPPAELEATDTETEDEAVSV